MSDRLEAIVEARDNASAKFRQVSDSARQLDQQLDRTSSTASRFSATGAAVGAALGTLAGIMGDAARAAGEAEVSQARLETAIESTGELYELYADQLERAGEAAVQMGFDDEAAADSISALIAVTEDANVAIERQALVMDIARGRGIDLAAATKIVIAAENERFGALARIGIVLDENATKEEAIAALQAKYAGQAEAYAETQIGALDELSQMYENGMEAIGGYAGEAQLLLMILPGLSAGFTAVAAAVGGVTASLNAGALSRLTGGAFMGGAGIAAGGILGGLGLVGYMLANPQDTGISEGIPYFDAFQDDAVAMDKTIQHLISQGEEYAAATGAQSDSIIADLEAQATRYQFLMDKWEDPGGATQEQIAAWDNERLLLMDQLGQRFADNSASYLEGLAQDTNAILGYTGEGAQLAQAELRELNEQFEAGALSPAEYANQVYVLSTSLADFDEQAANGVTTAGELADGYRVVGEVAGRASAEMAKNARMVAEAQQELTESFGANVQALTQQRDALTDVFRVFVGNTDAIAKQGQAVEDWSTGLIEAELSAENYATALESHNRILAANASIQEDVLSIQAQLSPYIATATENLAEQIDVLEGADTDAQLFALGMMDAATASQALALAQGYLADQDTFGPMIEQAALLNPALAQILEELGLISYDPHEGTVELLGVDEAKTDLETLNDTLERLAYTNILIAVNFDQERAEEEFRDAFGYGIGEEPIPLTVPVDPNLLIPDDWQPPTELIPVDTLDVRVPVTAIPEINWGTNASYGDGTGGPDPFGFQQDLTVQVTADTASAQSQVDELAVYASAQEGEIEVGADITPGEAQTDELVSYTDGQTGTINVDGDTSGATAAVDSAVDYGNAATATIQIDGDASGYYAAIPVLGQVLGTNYIDIVTRQMTQVFGSGGVARYATGGVVAEMGEYGDEVVHFADGGVGRTRGRGLYGLPGGSYVTPAPASIERLRGGGGVTVVVNVGGSVITEGDLAAVVAEAIAPVLLDVLEDEEMRAPR